MVAGIIAPNGNMEKIFILTISIFFLTALITPLFNIKAGFSFHFASQSTLAQTTSQAAQKTEKTMDAQIVSEAEKRIEDLIQDCAVRNKYNPLKTDVSITKNGTKIEIKSATVWLTSKEYRNASSLKDAVKKELDIELIIKNSEVKDP